MKFIYFNSPAAAAAAAAWSFGKIASHIFLCFKFYAELLTFQI
jgi:hypothetical protein